jgi:hypothetical protein
MCADDYFCINPSFITILSLSKSSKGSFPIDLESHQSGQLHNTRNDLLRLVASKEVVAGSDKSVRVTAP